MQENRPGLLHAAGQCALDQLEPTEPPRRLVGCSAAPLILNKSAPEGGTRKRHKTRQQEQGRRRWRWNEHQCQREWQSPGFGALWKDKEGHAEQGGLTEDGARKGRMNARRRTPSLFDVPQGTVVTPTTSPASSTAAEAAQWAVAADTVTASWICRKDG